MVCDMLIDPHGEITDYRFYPAIFRSQARLTYDQVWNWLTGVTRPESDLHRGLQPHLQTLYTLFKVLVDARGKRGAIDFETIETMMVFNAQGKIEKIVPVRRNDAHRLIEECMLAANVCASDFLQAKRQPCLYRIHEGPTAEKLEALRNFLKEFGIGLGGGDNPTARDYAKLLESIKSRPDAQLLQTVMLRSLRQAVYSPDNVGHFGLAYEAYSHFTSPIRRYPDLLVHRAIKAVLASEQYQPGDWDEIGLHCSMTERRADDATRDVVAWLKCYGSSATTCRIGLARSSPVACRQWYPSASLLPWTMFSSRDWSIFRILAAIISTLTRPAMSWWVSVPMCVTVCRTGCGSSW